MDNPPDTRPNPDPTRVTVEQFERAAEQNRRDTAALKELLETKLSGVQGVLEARLDCMDRATAAALQAAKEAVGQQNKSSAEAIAKSEAATSEQIKSLNTLISTVAGGLTSKIDDVKERQTIVQGHSKGIGDGIGYMALIAGLVIALISLIVFHK